MIKTKVTELPCRIVPQGLQSQKLNEWSNLYRNMVDAYKRLPFHCGEEALPLNPKLITAERFTGYVNKMMCGLNEDGRLVWKKLLSDALMNINVIRAFFNSFPMAEFCVDDNVSIAPEKRFHCNNKLDVIRTVCEIDVPEDCTEYFEKIQAMAKAMNEMRDYERCHGIQQHSMGEMTFYAAHADEFAQRYISGYFQKK